MPFREKSAWITLVCMLATFGVFFFVLGHGLIDHGMMSFHVLLMTIMAFVALQVVLHLANILMAPKDAKVPVDERERLIGLKAMRNAYLALMIGAIAVPATLHLGVDFHDLPYVALLALFIAEVVRAVSQIVYYRLGR
jgi:hypothetical protein